MRYKFPRTLKAAEASERSQWAIGDALVAEAEDKFTGPRGLDAVAKELAENGIELGVQYLRDLRRTAIAFPSKSRLLLAWGVHIDAGNPDTLNAVVAAAKKTGDKVTKTFVRAALQQMRQQEREEVQKRRIDADREVERAKKTGDLDQVRKAVKERKEVKAPPVRERPAPQVEDIPFMVARTRFRVAMGDIAKSLRIAEKEITPYIEEFSPAFISASVEELLEIANTARTLADKIRKNASNKRGHLAAV